MGDKETAVVRVAERIGAIPAVEWDACANPEAARYNPFLSHAFLSALEVSGAVSGKTGWTPRHLTLDDGAGGVLAAMPCYLKSHSLGEYVFDHGWAEAYARAGGRYYPKLQSAIPFTPVTGRRLLVPAAADADMRERLLLQAALQLMARRQASSLHLTFVTQDEWRRLGKLGLLQRTDQQFHWLNEGYGGFDDFLSTLASRKRKAIRKERRAALPDGAAIEWATGSDLTEGRWDAFFGFYLQTGSRKWGRPYLNRLFFSLIGEAMPERILLVMAKRAGRYIAGALHFIGGDTLYGRYWGCIEEQAWLHFEACYYQAIEFAIAHQIARVEAGAQGPHKLARGYLPQTTYSLHYLADPALHEAVARFLERERAAVEEENEALADLSPYKNSAPHSAEPPCPPSRDRRKKPAS